MAPRLQKENGGEEFLLELLLGKCSLLFGYVEINSYVFDLGHAKFRHDIERTAR
jgi:hypothetical protein